MENFSQHKWSPFNGRSINYRNLSAAMIGSFLVHATLVGMLFIGFDRGPRITAMPSAINVTMISMGELPAPAPARKTQTGKPSPQLPEEPEAPLVTEEDLAAMAPEAPAAVENAPPPPAPEEPAIKKPTIKKPADIPKPIPPKSKEQVVVEDAPKAEEPPPAEKKPAEKPNTAKKKPSTEEPKPKVVKPNAQAKKVASKETSAVSPSDARAESIKEAINKVKARAKKSSGSQSGGSTLAANRSGSVDGGTGRAGGATGAISDIYKAQISYQIERNWAFSATLAGGRKDLRTVLVITILPAGKIQNIWYEQRSGNHFLDQSAYNAVMKSDPLPPLPKGHAEYTIALVFTPAGLN